jgi:indole-3-glycerol phosphate synthase
MPTSLEEIVNDTARGLPALRQRRAALERKIEGSAVSRPSFAAALRRKTVAVIAEIKRRSPSEGSIQEDLDPGERAVLYASHGAAAVSVLTDRPYFGGSIQDLQEAANRCTLPLLRKDFILDEVQILEARAAGASAVLLIVRILDRPTLEALVSYTRSVGLEPLVEVHTEAELETALKADALVIGVNSRDLTTFRVDTQAAWQIIRRVPPDRLVVAESGITGPADILQAASSGADAVLVGAALSRAPSPANLLRELAGVPRYGR